MQIELSKVSFTDAGPKFRGKMYVGIVKMKAWPDGADTKVENPVIDVNLQGLYKIGLRASVDGPPNTNKDGKPLKDGDEPDNQVVDGPFLSDEECYKKFTGQLEPQINAIVAEDKAGLTKPQREQKILDDTKLDGALAVLEVSVNG